MSSKSQRVVAIFSKGCSFELVGACLKTAREFDIEPTWYQGIPPPVPPMTNNVVLEAVADLDAATIIVVVSTELPVTPAWLAGPVARSFERGARFFEFVFSSDQRQFETGAANEHHPPLAASVEELQSLFRTALRSVLERQ